MKSYSNDLRERAVQYLLAGHTYTETSEVYNVSRCALWQWMKLLNEQGNLNPRPRRKYFKKINPQKLVQYLEEHPDAYLSETAEIFSCSEAAVCKALQRIGYTKKKKKTSYKEQDKEKVAEYIDKIKDIPSDELVCIY